MPQYFTLTLCNYRRYGWLAFSGMMTSLALAAVVLNSLPKGNGAFAIFLLVAGSGFYGVYRLLQKVVLYPVLVTLGPDYLAVQYLSAGRVENVPFAEVVAYREELLRDGEELRFRLRSGRKVRLATNTFLGPATDEYYRLLQALRPALTQYSADQPFAIKREKSFYEKPFATVLLVLCSAMLLFAAGEMIINHKPFKGNFISAIGAWLTYFGLWWAGRARHHRAE